MIIVNGQHIRKYHAANLILDQVSFEVHEGERIGLIGRNGSGKSTLLQLIARHTQPDEGMLTVKKDIQVGYLPQIPAEFDEGTVHEALACGFRHLAVCREEMTGLEQQMADPAAAGDADALNSILDAYARLQEQFEREGGYEMDARIDQIADGLQIPKASYAQPFRHLSGGEKTRIALASQLIQQPELLLLDEPTNHLDLKGMEWLEHFLQSYTGACLIVSHDRYFLDRVVSRIMELEDGEAHHYPTNYSGYLREKEERLLQQFADYQEQQKVIRKMKETIRQLEEWGRIGSNEKFFKRAASMRKALERMEQVKKPVLERRSADFNMSPLDRSGRRVLSFEQLYKTFGERMILSGAEGHLQYGEKVVLLGDNGSGKTTLFKLILGEEQADGGELQLGTRLDIGYLAQQAPAADGTMTVLEYYRTEAGMEEGEARGVLARYLFYGADVFKRVGQLSGGEWSRLRLALLVRRKPNLLLLDEPTNHLDIASREALEEALEEFPGTILAISHDRYFMNRLAQRVWELEGGRVHSYLGNFDEYREQRRRRAAVAAAAGPSTGGPDSRRAAEPSSAAGRGSGAARQAAPVSAPRPSAGRLREQLERRMAALEAELAAADYELQRLSSAGEAAALLQAQWEAREALQQELDRLLEEWMELE
ncbi:ABC-F family ATP-binding cassette domain-containing protein [Paenibacillus sp. JX-17]|uniref:ABC-F family ATP-binding cassette domain-containing protein n=1 Tax=Paenibacillus lacisoli TaxID=3064525 RepID=A0ABT9CAS9_9BACL|nr:ABC-F family ATP-binding cassette domain-containing protein [Paenibacillus sp. JX-17]MDO7906364.1 ABC-F family ATP-binding cassette domain-containing protein [Paenibacillus sp. JX-17]